MSTDYKLEKEITMDQLFDGQLDSYGIKEAYSQGKTSPNHRYLTDGKNGLAVFGDGIVEIIKRCGNNAPNKILLAISDEFDTQIFSEFEPQFWGYETEEEWEAVERSREQVADLKCYEEIMRFVRGEANDIEPDSYQMSRSQIAKELINENPDYAHQTRMNELLGAIDQEMKKRATVSSKSVGSVNDNVLFLESLRKKSD